MKSLFSLLLIALLSLSLVSCSSDDAKNDNDKTNTNQTLVTTSNKSTSPKTSSTADIKSPTDSKKPGNPVPKYTVDWPSKLLPEGFPNLGKVTKVSEASGYSNRMIIYWNIITEDQIKDFVEKLNAYLDYDHAWQEYFYSDGIKYKDGTEDTLIKVVIRHMSLASGEVDDDFEPQFFLELSGAWFSEKK